ncbi:MAG: MFS transporter [Actinomycetales bacterium]
MSTDSSRAGAVAPLYLAGFTTACGAHGVAVGLGLQAGDVGLALLGFGVMLALYDVAEVILKPVFGALSDRIGVIPVIVGGLVVFSVASVAAALFPMPIMLAVSRFVQGAAAAAFSPASSSAVARLAGPQRLGRYFGRYGGWKSLGYAVGPLLAAVMVTWSGIGGLYWLLAALSAAVAVAVLVKVPRLSVLARPRYTVADLWRQTADRTFLVPTLVLAASTAVLGVAVGYIPLLAVRAGLAPLVGAGAVAAIAVVASVAQPIVGQRHDGGRLSARAGTSGALVLAAVAVLAMAISANPAVLYLGSLLVGLAVGTATPLAYAQLAAATPPERLGRTMGNAELGREIGDAGGPILVGAVSAGTALPVGLAALGAVLLVAGAGSHRWGPGASRGQVAGSPRPAR